jgi:hypothetical protein
MSVFTSRTNQYFSASLLFLVVSIAACAGFAYTIELQQQELVERVTQIQENDARANARIQLRRLTEQTLDERSTLSRYYLQNDEDGIDLLTLIEEWSMLLGLEIGDFSLGQADGENHAWRVLRFPVEGTNESVRTMVQLLESMPYQSELKELQLQMDKPRAVQANVTLWVGKYEHSE